MDTNKSFDGHAKRVEINLSVGYGSVVVDGIDLSRFIKDLSVYCAPGELPTVNITIPAIVLEMYAEAREVIGEFVDKEELEQLRKFGNEPS
jgi:hypothetical protein